MRRLALLALLALPFPALAQDQTAEDRGFLTRFLEEKLSGAGRDVRIDGFAGALSSRATFVQMTIADDEGVWITLRNGAIQWNRSALLRGRVEVAELSAKEIDVARAPGTDSEGKPEASAEGFSLPELPVSVEIGTLRAETVHLAEPVIGVEAEVSLAGTLRLADGEGSAKLDVSRTDGSDGTLTLDADFSNATRQARVDLLLKEGADGIAANLLNLPGRPDVVLAISGDAPINDFKADLSLLTEGVQRLKGTGTWKTTRSNGALPEHDFTLDAGGDVLPLIAPAYRAFFGDQVRLKLDGHRAPDGALALHDLSLDSQALDVTGKASLRANGMPQDFDLRAKIGLESREEVLLPIPGGSTVVRSGDVTLRYDAETSEDWSLDARLFGLRQGGVTMRSLRLMGDGFISPDSPRKVDGRLIFAAAGVDPGSEALAQASGDFVSGNLRFGWIDGQPLEISDLSVIGRDYAAQGQANVTLTKGDVHVETFLTGQHRAISRLSGLIGRPVSGQVEGALKGWVEPVKGQFALDLSTQGTDLTSGVAELDRLLKGSSKITGKVSRSPEGITLDGIELLARTLTAKGGGVVKTDASSLDGTLDFSDLSVLGPAYKGALQLTASLREEPGAQKLTFTGGATGLAVGVAELDRLLAGDSTLSGEVVRRGEVVEIRRAEVKAKTLDLSASGLVGGAATSVDAKGSFTDLSVLGPKYRGALTLDAHLREVRGVQKLSLTGQGQGLAIGQPEVDALLRGSSVLSAEVEREGERITLNSARVASGPLTASASGSLTRGAMALTGDVAMTDLSALGRGFSGALDAKVALRDDGPLRRFSAEGSGRGLRLGSEAADTLLAGMTTFRVSGTERDGRIAIERLDARNPQVTLTGAGDTSAFTLDGRIADAALLAPGFPGPIVLRGKVLNAGGGRVTVDMAGTGPGGTQASVRGGYANGAADLAITGTTQAAIVNGFTNFASVEGPVSFDLALKGRPALESLSGRVGLTNARIALPSLGTSIDGVSGEARLSGGQADLSAQGRFPQGGTLRVSGPVQLGGTNDARLSITLDNARLRDPELYDTTVSGNLSVTGPLQGGALIAGNLALGQTELRVPSTGFSGAADLIAIRHYYDSAAVRETRRKAGLLGAGNTNSQGRAAVSGAQRAYPLNVTISAPNRLFVRGRGLDAELGGEMTLGGTTADIRPSGQFELIRGRIDVLGQRITLTRGEVTLQGALVPWLSFTAETETPNDVIYVKIEGEANAPRITFESGSGLPQEEVLSQLIFGRDLTTLSPFQAAQLASAVATLSGRGGEGIIGNLRKGFGLDDLDLRTDEGGNATLKAGKYLSENVYTDVEVTSDGKTKINLNLDISKQITGKGSLSSDGNSSVGVYFEKDY